jgi:CubicO group peptidase (beta-lactamase class C family)
VTRPLGELLSLGDVSAAGVTLDSISTHRSGLPGLPKSAHPLRRSIALWRHGTNPYGETLEELLAQAGSVDVGKPRARCSNFGFELLGHAIASAAGTTFADLVHGRLAGPLGLGCFYVPAAPDQLRADALAGQSKRGKPRQPWTGEALAPAGGVRSCIQDMARLAAALLAGSAPGIAALDPVAPFGRGARIGAGWVTTEVGGRVIT